MLLGLRTDSGVAELRLLTDAGVPVADSSWKADRELAHGLLRKIDQFLTEHALTLQDITGLFVFEGPGSFTGLRIGLTVVNTLAYSLKVPIVGECGEEWVGDAAVRLQKGDNDQVVLPFYGADARITTPKK